MDFTRFRTYKISKKSITTFRKKGLSEPALESLSGLEEQLFESKETFISRLQTLPHTAEIMENEPLILKKTGRYFRLDKWIPNKTLREWVEALIFALVVATIVRTFLFAPFKIPSGSMIPTIAIGDHIFATMFSYGVPVPFTDIKLFPQPIKRGDIVIFPYPKDPSVDYIKRVVALEGEIVQIIEDRVYINGKFLQESYTFFDPQQQQLDQIQMLMLKRNGIDLVSPVSNYGPVTIPEGKIFVMGDNRYNSADSRYWGFVNIKTVKGKGKVIYWSHDPRLGLFEGYHFDRIFSTLK